MTTKTTTTTTKTTTTKTTTTKTMTMRTTTTTTKTTTMTKDHLAELSRLLGLVLIKSANLVLGQLDAIKLKFGAQWYCF